MRRLEKADERRHREIMAILRTLGRNAQKHADFCAEMRRMAREQQRIAGEKQRMAGAQLRVFRDMKRFAEEQERLAKEQKRIAKIQRRQGDRLDASIKALYRLLEHRLS